MWIQLAWAIGSMLVSYALQAANKPKIPKPVAGTLDVPQPQPGALIGVAFGTNVFKSGNITWYGGARTLPIKKSGGK